MIINPKSIGDHTPIGGDSIIQVSTNKYLGVRMDAQLSWCTQVDSVCARIQSPRKRELRQVKVASKGPKEDLAPKATEAEGQGEAQEEELGEEGQEEFQEQTGEQTQTDLGQLDLIQTLSRGDGETFPARPNLSEPTAVLTTEQTNVLTKDACLLRQDPGGCQNYTMKWFFDTEQRECSRFWYGGCEGNNNRFETQDECEIVCLSTRR
ncbi:amyloid-beta precursor protein-like [Lampris incognitus]|uniref:amyloid-beta precursor protein-like n=1 Tax=Lampris incognitus TaxID=2546036 RepID=UPI0024B5B2EC|nr:amyloid-beta precursor protein-like [Lampris incognitus]